jgi:uncharacterized protein
MKRLLLLLILLAPLVAMAQNPAADSAWFVINYTKREVYITMRDGVRLFTALYEPKAPGKHPILLNRTPYSIGPYGEDRFKGYWNSHYMAYLRHGYIMVCQDVRGRYMSEGEFVDVRPYIPEKKGKETDEASDTYDTIDWLVKNAHNNNGKVGVYGISYPGFYSTEAALCGHPALKAVSPQAPVTDWFMGDDFHHNGAFMMMDAFAFYSGFGKPRPEPTTKGSAGYQFTTSDNYQFYLGVGSIHDLASLLHDSVRFFNDLYAHPNYDSWWKERNARSQVQHIPGKVATLVVGGLFDAEDCYGAWNLYKAIEQKAGNNNKLVMGPWSHGGWARGAGDYLGNVRFGQKTSEWYQKNIEIPFFDHYLLGKGDLKHIEEATIFFSGADEWHSFNQWPPADMQPLSLFFHGDNRLSPLEPLNTSAVTEDEIEKNLNNRIKYFTKLYGSTAELEHNAGKSIKQIKEENREAIAAELEKERMYGRSIPRYKEYVSDPAKPVPYSEGVQMGRTREYMDDDQRFASRRTDVVVFQTDTLTTDITLAGPVVADLWASLSTTDADFVVKLIDVFPDNFKYNDSTDGKGWGKPYTMGGYQMLVRGEVMRGRYRNSFEHPEPFEPWKATEVKYTLPDVAHVFKKGHRIMVQVQSSWFPLVDRNPQQFVDIYHCSAKDYIPSDVRIYTSSQHPSRVILPVVNSPESK